MRGENRVNIQGIQEESYVDKRILLICKVTSECPSLTKSKIWCCYCQPRSNTLRMCSEVWITTWPPHWGCCRSICYWAELLSTPSAAMQRSLTGKPELGWGWAGVERRQHTGARQPDMLSLVLLPLNLLVHWREGFFLFFLFFFAGGGRGVLESQ